MPVTLAPLAATLASAQTHEDLDTPFVVTPDNVVNAMLDLASVRAGDRLIDLGSGDGRIVIAAAQRGATGVGIDIDRYLVEKSRETARKLKLAPEKVVMTVDQHANTSAASVPLALDLAVRDGRIQAGDLLVLEAMGGGFTWGACVLRV